MTKGFAVPSPFGPTDSLTKAVALARMSSYGFGLSAGVSLIQAGAVWFAASQVYEPYRQGTAIFALFLAAVTAGLALWQWRRPNRILPVFGIAWALYELSAFMTSAMVGAPLGAEGVPVWSPYVSVAAMAVCLILHIGGVRGAIALGRNT